MWLFKALNSKEYDTLFKRITELHSTVEQLSTVIKAVQLENDDLRNKVLRKIQKPREQGSTISQEQPTQPPQASAASPFSMSEEQFKQQYIYGGIPYGQS